MTDFALSHYTAVFFESAPWETTSYVDPGDGCMYDTDKLVSDAFALPTEFVEALDFLFTHPDAVQCICCLDGIGFLLEEFNCAGSGQLTWIPTGLVRENDGPVRMVCEACTPYVPEGYPAGTGQK